MIAILTLVFFYIIIPVIILSIFGEFVKYRYDRSFTDITPITFKTFISLHNTNHYRWHWSSEDCNSHLKYTSSSGNYDVAFKTYIDYVYFKVWTVRKKSHAANKQRTENTLKIINEWKKDIQLHEKKGAEEIAAAAKELLKQSAELTGLSEETLKLLDKVKEKV